MNLSFWLGKRVFLTGHTGFKGSWMSLWLQSLGADVTGFALAPPSQPSLFEEAKVASGMRSIVGDVRDLNALQQAIHSAKPEIVIHMAAQPLVRDSYVNPVETYATNVMGTVHLLEAVRLSKGIKAVVNITTDKCYENREWVWGYRENEPLGGHDPYSNSKGCAELVSSAYRSSFFSADTYSQHGCALATARAGNVIGGGDWAKDRLIPDIIRGFEQGQIVSIRHPEAVRPWQHVLEPLRGYATLAQLLCEQGPRFAEGWNFGPNDEDAKTVGWIAQRMVEMWGPDAQWTSTGGDHLHEAHMLKLDISKARSRLGWHPKLALEQALQLTVDWSHERRNGGDVRQTTLAQISAYQKLIQE